jgi:hypothetical protein
MNTIYIVRTMTECVGTFNSAKSERVCDLDAGTTLFLFLSTPVLAALVCHTCAVPASFRLPGLLTSAAMLGFKLAHVEILKLKLEEQKWMEAERAALIAELDATLSPELALQVEVILDRRKSFVMPNGLSKGSSPELAHGLVGGQDVQESRGSVRQVRRSLRARSAIASVLAGPHASLDVCRGVRSRARQRMPWVRLPRRCGVLTDSQSAVYRPPVAVCLNSCAPYVPRRCKPSTLRAM